MAIGGIVSVISVAGCGSSTISASSSTTIDPANTSSTSSTLLTSTSQSEARQVIPSTPTGPATQQGAVKEVPDTSGIEGVTAWDTSDRPRGLSHDHVEGPVRYVVTPPVGGPHNQAWMNAGIYSKPIPAERAVHNLEHGAVWITYRPDLPASQVASLRAFVSHQSEIAGSDGQSNRYIDLSPWNDASLPSAIVISSWGHQLRVSQANDPRLQRFVDTFRNSAKYTPELGAPVDGVPVQIGGRPLG